MTSTFDARYKYRGRYYYKSKTYNDTGNNIIDDDGDENNNNDTSNDINDINGDDSDMNSNKNNTRYKYRGSRESI